MKPRQWQQINRLFHAALEREPSHRTAFLDEACAGDESLRREVEDLIAANDQAGSFIESPAYTVAAEMLMDGQDQSLVGGSISHYRIIEPLGTGGMGEVYLAQDTKRRQSSATTSHFNILKEATSIRQLSRARGLSNYIRTFRRHIPLWVSVTSNNGGTKRQRRSFRERLNYLGGQAQRWAS